METLERSRVCRLCGNNAEMAIDIFDKRGNHVKKINAVLPILVHQMDLLPKHICHPCNYKLEEFHKFYEDCLKTDENLKGQLSWMRGSVEREEKGVPMVQINNFMIKTELPDYDDGETTETTIFQTGNLTNYLRNNFTGYPEKFPSLATKCYHCGWDRENNNRFDNVVVNKKILRARGSKRGNVTNINNDKLASRDTIRRNLFATEIFGDKNSRLEPSIPVFNIPPEAYFRGARTKVLDTRVRLEASGRRQNGKLVGTKPEISDDNVKMGTRVLRSRKNGVTDGSRIKDSNGVRGKPFESVKIKIEPVEDVERNLRPRMEPIDYSETKRKNPMARTTSEKRKRSLENQSAASKVRTIKHNVSKDVRIKEEPQQLPESSNFSKTNNNSKSSSLLETVDKKSSKITFDDYYDKSMIDQKLSSKKNGNGTKTTESSRRRKLAGNRGVYASPYLRSQRGQLRNGKLKSFDSITERPKKIQSSKLSFGISLDSIKREKIDIDDRPAQLISKYRDCESCQCRFPNHELYMLHGCNTNKRH